MEVPAASLTVTPTNIVCHPSTWNPRAQKVAIVAIAVILAVAAGIAGSLLSIGAACGIAAGALILSWIVLNCARKCCCVAMEAKGWNSSEETENSSENWLQVSNLATCMNHLILMESTDAIDDFVDPDFVMYQRWLQIDASFKIRTLLGKHMQTSLARDTYLVPVFQHHKNQPMKFLYLAVMLGEELFLGKMSSFEFYEFLDKISWPSEELKMQKLPQIIKYLIDRKSAMNFQNIAIMDNNNQLLCNTLCSVIQVDIDFVQATDQFKLFMANAYYGNIHTDLMKYIAHYKKMGSSRKIISFFWKDKNISYTTLSFFLNKLAKLPGVLQQIEWAVSHGAGEETSFNKPFQIAGGDGFGDEDIENLLAIARRHPYLQCVWNGSKMSATGFAHFSEELNKILAQRIPFPTKEQLLMTADLP